MDVREYLLGTRRVALDTFLTFATYSPTMRSYGTYPTPAPGLRFHRELCAIARLFSVFRRERRRHGPEFPRLRAQAHHEAGEKGTAEARLQPLALDRHSAAQRPHEADD